MIILIIIIGDLLKSILSNIRKNYKYDFIRIHWMVIIAGELIC